MIIPDINLILYAEIDAYPYHPAARRWWQDTLNGDRDVGITSVTLFGFLRIATNRRVFADPLPLADAVTRVETWLERPNVTFLIPGPQHVETALRLLLTLGTGADLTTDVQLAAHAIENQAELHSNDLDFGRFSGLRWVNPISA